MKQYLSLLQHVIDHGVDRSDRTGTGTRSIFGYQMRFDLTHGFPAMTTKKIAWKSIVGELLWFLEGSTDERRLCEIIHGTRDDNKKTIWTENANANYWLPKAKFKGDLGSIYSKQWRAWGDTKIDQIHNVIQGILTDPYSRRHIVSAWNPAELSDAALPPCHAMFQFYVANNKLSCHLYARSQDIPLGTPFNIASYALLTHIIAHICGLQVGEYIHTIGDGHIYLNQLDGVREQLSRTPKELPTLLINRDKTNINEFNIDDFSLLNYDPDPHIFFPFST